MSVKKCQAEATISNHPREAIVENSQIQFRRMSGVKNGENLSKFSPQLDHAVLSVLNIHECN